MSSVQQEIIMQYFELLHVKNLVLIYGLSFPLEAECGSSFPVEAGMLLSYDPYSFHDVE